MGFKFKHRTGKLALCSMTNHAASETASIKPPQWLLCGSAADGLVVLKLQRGKLYIQQSRLLLSVVAVSPSATRGSHHVHSRSMHICSSWCVTLRTCPIWHMTTVTAEAAACTNGGTIVLWLPSWSSLGELCPHEMASQCQNGKSVCGCRGTAQQRAHDLGQSHTALEYRRRHSHQEDCLPQSQVCFGWL